MTFSRARYSKGCEYELIRFASKLNTTVIGAANKLFAAFTREWNHNSVVTYSDNRWNTGNVYQQMGFSKTNSGTGNYWYTKDYSKLYSRVQFQKHKLAEMLEIFSSEKTEWENMIDNGYDRVWDCGSDTYIWKKED